MSDSGVQAKKKYVRPVIKLIELARGPGLKALLQPATPPLPPPVSTSNVVGGVVFG